jgi:hypothetical protein
MNGNRHVIVRLRVAHDKNREAVLPQSPELPRSGYPGLIASIPITPEGVVPPASPRTQPFQG